MNLQRLPSWLALLPLLAAASVAQAQWVEQSPIPTGLGVRGLVFTSPTHGWLATAGSQWDETSRRALLETRDGGLTWTHHLVPAADDEPLYGVCFLDGQRGWAYGNVSYRTTDGGATWHPMPFLGSTYRMHFHTPTFGIATGNFGFALSSNGGQSWEVEPAGPRAFDFRDGALGLGIGPGAIYRTTDGGATFAPVFGSGGPAVAFLSADVAVAVAGGQFARSADGGATWAPVAPAEGRNVLLRVSDSVVLAWAVTGVTPNPDGRLFRSADGGQTWADLGTVFPDGPGQFAVASPTLVLATDGDGDVYRSADAGATWTRVFEPPFFGYGIGGMPLAFPSAEVGYLAYDYGLIYKTTDGGLTWRQLSNGTGRDLADLVRLSGEHLVAVGLGGVVLVTEDGGATWLVRQDGEELYHDLVAVQAVGPAHVVASDTEGRVFQSTDGGYTWTRTGERPDPYAEFRAYDLHFFDAQNGWVVGTRFNFRSVYRTADGGQTWTPSDLWSLWTAVDFEGQRGWIAYVSGVIARTDDGGATWTHVNLPGGGETLSMLDVEFFDANVGYAVGRRGYMAKSTDGGLTWTRIRPDPRAPEFADDFSDIDLPAPDQIWLSTYDGVAYHSIDGGATWERSALGSAPLSFDSFTGVAATAGGRAWLAGFKGYVYQFTSGLVHLPVPVEPGAEVEALALAVAPNPARGRAAVTLALPSAARVAVAVHDVLGRTVVVLHDGALAAGEHALSLDAAALTPGVYLVRAEAAGRAVTHRLVVVR